MVTARISSDRDNINPRLSMTPGGRFPAELFETSACFHWSASFHVYIFAAVGVFARYWD
jgi:hypothetical protein